ncbi:glutaredoxin 3 [Thiomicrorhabdus aquaedulcis]|jgi:glutaredoxin 3|uniref:glutaredoxin 3 n=1 Tax=Thiomicrorhabdus aquaedulcis TaxID=2211106 RepID=UPI000FD7E60C|nr:glutaredoxin 3 [Thiomicrorhabdus aquaedulcis]
MAEVTIYCTMSCPYCTMAKRLLDSKGVKYQSIDVGGNAALWAEMEAKTGRNTVPQIYIGTHHVGGFDDLSAADKRGEIDPLLNA